ncbi:MAG: hypothetical protein HKO64_04130 [Xanthomonadales bacterium]|nr:hypothetical protein [Xanthomonadales bacterium]NNL94787.1 hypothetical protein [Xanthomonadales bacterium]
MSRLTDLECHALAHLDVNGPMSGYRLRTLFASSPTNALSAGAGSIYPLLKRLEQRGFVIGKETGDGRGTRILRCSGKGIKAAMRWIADTRDSGVLGEDGMRSRAYFIDRLSAAERKAWLEQSLQACQEKLLEVKRFKPLREDSLGARWTTDHALRVTQARIAWLQARLNEQNNEE